jgi:D-hydroxyproline dehydrogenase subunit beta
MPRSDCVVVGAGIIGLATAYALLKAGKTVTILDRDSAPLGASIRNFGMVWPVGLPSGPASALAMRSREIWLEAARSAGFWIEPCGSLHLAYAEDELAVLREFVSMEHPDRGLELLGPEQTRERAPGVNPVGLLGAMWSPTELNVESRSALPAMWEWISGQPGIRLIRAAHAVAVTTGVVEIADGRRFEANEIYLTAGRDGVTLYPELFPASSFVPCKLQMLRTVPQPDGWRVGTHIAGGWTLRHYKSFAACPSLPALSARISEQQPEFDRYGIHIMASQHSGGDLVLGDSHVYGQAITPFDDERIDRIIMENVAKLISPPTWEISHRWHGIYLKRTDGQITLVARPEPGVTVINGVGGLGMTLSFGLAERVVQGGDGL